MHVLHSAAQGGGAARGSGGGLGAAAGERAGLRTWTRGLQLRPSRLRNEPARRTAAEVVDDVKDMNKAKETSGRNKK